MTGSPAPRGPAVRRPPAPVSGWASVTRLSPPSVPAAGDPVPLAVVQGTLALDLEGYPASPVTPDLHLVDDPARSRTEREVHLWATRFAQATVEVLGGDRPVSQLVRWTTARVYQDLERRVRILARAAPATHRRRSIRPQVQSVHVCLPAERCAEVSVHVRYGPRSRAVAARIENRAGRWVCTALQLG